jgi:hypothetical protein
VKPSLPLFFSRSLLVAVAIIGAVTIAQATVDDALAFAYEAALPYHKQYAFRKDAWGGDLGFNDRQPVRAQLFKGNEYWFIVGSDVKTAVISVHLYNEEGQLSETTSWQKPNDKKRFSAAGASIIPKQTGTYLAIVEVHKSPEERTHWALVYGYKDTIKK